MTKEKRDIQIVLDKLRIEYSQDYQEINDLDYFIYKNKKSKWGKDFPDQIEFREQYLKYLKKQHELLKERIDDLSKQFKECK